MPSLAGLIASHAFPLGATRRGGEVWRVSGNLYHEARGSLTALEVEYMHMNIRLVSIITPNRNPSHGAYVNGCVCLLCVTN